MAVETLNLNDCRMLRLAPVASPSTTRVASLRRALALLGGAVGAGAQPQPPDASASAASAVAPAVNVNRLIQEDVKRR